MCTINFNHSFLSFFQTAIVKIKMKRKIEKEICNFENAKTWITEHQILANWGTISSLLPKMNFVLSNSNQIFYVYQKQISRIGKLVNSEPFM